MTNETTVQLTHDDDVTILHLARSVVDRAYIREYFDELMVYIDNHQPRKLVVNFDQVTHFSSEAIGGLIRTARRVRSYGGDVKLCDMSGDIRGVFQITNLDGTIFKIYDSVREASGDFTV